MRLPAALDRWPQLSPQNRNLDQGELDADIVVCAVGSGDEEVEEGADKDGEESCVCDDDEKKRSSPENDDDDDNDGGGGEDIAAGAITLVIKCENGVDDDDI